MRGKRRLIHRTTRRLAVTEEGQHFHARCRRALHEIADAARGALPATVDELIGEGAQPDAVQRVHETTNCHCHAMLAMAKGIRRPLRRQVKGGRRNR